MTGFIAALAACGGDDAPPVDARSCAELADPHDEDSDGVVDACDNCPAHANPTQADSTEQKVRAFADGVGDVCDPRTGASGDELRAFYSFASADQASAWTGNGWMISDDALHAIGTAAWSSTRAQQGDGYFVRAEIASLTATTPSGFSITLDGDGVSTGATCTLQDMQLTAAEVGGTPMSIILATPIGPAEPVTLIAWRTISLSGSTRIPELTCRVMQGSAMKEVSVVLSDELAAGSHVIASIDALVDITSLSVYTSPGPKNP